jgi:hypothetical protein
MDDVQKRTCCGERRRGAERGAVVLVALEFGIEGKAAWLFSQSIKVYHVIREFKLRHKVPLRVWESVTIVHQDEIRYFFICRLWSFL